MVDTIPSTKPRPRELVFIGIARERLYDRQQRRLLQLGCLNNANDVAERLNQLLVAGVESSDKTTYVNGVHQAVQLIIQLVSNDLESPGDTESSGGTVFC